MITDMKIEYNKHRVEYLLSLFKMTAAELLSSINKGLKTPITWDDIDSDEIELNYLKRIDKVFNKGLLYYYDPTVPVNAQKLESIAHYDYHVDYGHDLVAGISKETNLSRLAIFTNLFLQHRMTYADYSNVREDLHEQYLARKEREQLENGIINMTIEVAKTSLF